MSTRSAWSYSGMRPAEKAQAFGRWFHQEPAHGAPASRMKLVERPAHKFTTLLLQPAALFASLNWAFRARCSTVDGATARTPGGTPMTSVLVTRRGLLVAGSAVLASGVPGLLLPARAEGLAPTSSMPGGA